MVKLEKEVRWAAILSVLQRDSDKLIAVISSVLTELRVDEQKHREKCVADGIVPASDAIYQRYFKLYTELGGLYYVLRGADGVLSSLICEMLDNKCSDGK